ncbi:Asp-tRNA(Asn)/Glu-tRNA(Gln) amidotransferase subunit GatC [Aeropyrum camini]|uniref:Aspartyl/glutamyl-tRNA amidotransferase C subunit n=1 Tax=Aeropyrum camini SY1 = JCM 12091 TaxID=1198449 RepID=U3TAI3_9CREN|nr:aspartyl/glutamyl-tRNA amidotransferase subunit C [Aeropyrum camini]BAN90542.1 aspartyl/glutamyl-tRNA amidotransferase C subunit [Aeropyrum camini SY1 = JCM 12091]
MAEEKGCSILERLREIAHIELVGDEKEIVCRDIERIADYLGQVSSALEELGVDPEPLYHVWETQSRIRDGLDRKRMVSVESFLEPGRLDGEGRVRVPWREVGGR